MRHLLEIHALRRAIERATDADVERIASAISPHVVSDEEAFIHHRDFHTSIMRSAGNGLLYLAAQPIFSILHDRVQPAVRNRKYQELVTDHHEAILRAMAIRDAELAVQLMEEHLAFVYAKMKQGWRTRKQHSSPSPSIHTASDGSLMHRSHE
jgi:DNA-binding FadR family transcriptional regulator